MPLLSPAATIPAAGETFLLPLCLNSEQLNKVISAMVIGHRRLGENGVSTYEDASYMWPLFEAMAYINDPSGQGCWTGDNALCQAVIDCLETASGDLGAFTACLAGKVLEDCLELLANQVTALAGDYTDIWKDLAPPTYAQMNAQYNLDYGVDMPLPALEIRINECDLEYRWEGAPEWSLAGDLTTCEALQGAPGLPGADGAPGLPGADGAPGLPGADGEPCVPCLQPINPPTTIEPATVGSENVVCGGMLHMMDYLFDFANYFLDLREAEISGANLVIRLTGIFPFLENIGSLADFASGLAEYTVALARAQINDPDFRQTYTCQLYGLTSIEGRYTSWLHEAFEDSTPTFPIPSQQDIMDYMLYLVGFERMNTMYIIGTASPSDACELLCASIPDPLNPLNLVMYQGTICEVTEDALYYYYQFQSTFGTYGPPLHPTTFGEAHRIVFTVDPAHTMRYLFATGDCKGTLLNPSSANSNELPQYTGSSGFPYNTTTSTPRVFASAAAAGPLAWQIRFTKIV